MTREEQIEKVINDDWNHLEGDCPDVAFRKGVNWADSHPNWHKYPEEKPKKDGRYWVVFETPSEKCTEVTTFHDSRFQSLCFEEDSGYEDDFLDADYITAWMELPEPPKFD